MRLPLPLLTCLLGALACAPATRAAVAEHPWPPRDPSSPLFVHYGEERWDDPDGGTILPKIVSETVRYRPAMVTTSGDKAGNGTSGELGAWRAFMEPYDRAGIPYFPAIGNSDRRSRGAGVVQRGRLERYEAFGKQPVSGDPAQVEMLELRDPKPRRPASGTVSAAQQSVPTTTPTESLPAPARMFTSSNPFALEPKAPAADDSRRDKLTQTKNGLFRARCPGRARVRVTSGFETTVKDVRVPSRAGPIARSVRVTSRRTLRLRLRPRLPYRVARARLSQPAEVLIRVRRRGRTVRTLKHVCAKAGRLTVLWDGRVRRRGRLVRSGAYRIEAEVRSDRRTIRRSRAVRVTR